MSSVVGRVSAIIIIVIVIVAVAMFFATANITVVVVVAVVYFLVCGVWLVCVSRVYRPKTSSLLPNVSLWCTCAPHKGI